jgi:hypothetical protein
MGNITKLPARKRIIRYVKWAEEVWLKQNPRASKKALEILQLSCALAEGLLPVYFRYWKKSLFEMKWDDGLTEVFHKMPFQVTGHDNVPINTKMDSAYWVRQKRRNKKFVRKLWLFETKTSSRINEDDLIETLPIGLQHAIYMMALQHIYGKMPRGVLYNYIRRPQIYRRKEEEIQDYVKRCVADAKKRPDFYFLRLEMVTDKDEVEEARGEVQGIINEFLKWIDGKVIHYRSTNSCIGRYGRCPYLPICANDDWTFFTGGPSRAKKAV